MILRSFFLMLSFLMVLLLTACVQSGVLEAQVVPAAQLDMIPAELDELQPLALSFLDGNPEDRQMLVQYQDAACVPFNETTQEPTCRAGEATGTLVKVFPVGGSARSFYRPEEVGQIIGWSVDSLYAVYRPVEQSAVSYWPVGEYALLFERTEQGKPAPLVAVASAGRLVRLEVYPGLTAAQVLDGIPLEQVLLPPNQVRGWSGRFDGYSLLTQATSSEDGRWLAETMLALPPEGGEQYYRWLQVAGQDNSQVWPVVSEWAPFGAGFTTPLPLVWSDKAPVLYWTYTPTPEGCVVFANASDLNRLDLTTGVSQRLVDPQAQWLALSPDETQVAAVTREGLSLFDLTGGKARTAALPSGQAGQIVWAPDGSALVLTVAHDPCTDQTSYSILRLDVQSMALTTLIDHDRHRFATLEWSAMGSVLLADIAGNPWLMDPQTGEIWQETGPQEQSSPGSIYGWVGLADWESDSSKLLGGIRVQLGGGACPATGLAEASTITSDISYSFTSLPAGTYCVSIDPQDPVNRALLPPGGWVLPVHTFGIAATTVVLADGEIRLQNNFTWMPANP